MKMKFLAQRFDNKKIGLFFWGGARLRGEALRKARIRACRPLQISSVNKKYCYGEIGRHTGLRGLGKKIFHLGSSPSSNNLSPCLFSSTGKSIRFIRGRLLVQI